MFLLKPSRWRNRFLTEPANINATAGNGALLPLAPGATFGRSCPECMDVWTGCLSQLRACCRKSLICIRPVARLAGRGLDGNTHALLISLAARPPGGH